MKLGARSRPKRRVLSKMHRPGGQLPLESGTRIASIFLQKSDLIRGLNYGEHDAFPILQQRLKTVKHNLY